MNTSIFTNKFFLAALVAIGFSANVWGQASIRINSPASGTNANTMLGSQVPLITSGTNNTFLGTNAGKLNTTGSQNTFVGLSGYRNTTGNYNTFLGWNSGSMNVSGIENTYLGGQAGAYATGSQNVMIGVNSGHSSSTGNNNVFAGYFSGGNNTGNGNVFLGNTAGQSNTSGTNNVIIGNNANVATGNLTNAIAIGNNAVVSASNTLVLGGTGANAVNVGIGTNAPTQRLDVVGNAKVSGLAGTGTRMVVADANGLLSTQAIPTGGTGTSYWAANGTTGIQYNTGTVLIGNATTPAGYKLYVETGILTEKLKVALKTSTDWADYVFGKNYQLKPLAEVEAFVKENKHLPDVPSAQALVNDGGIDVGQMLAKQMQKIEELTLYMIDLQKQNDALKSKVEALESQ